MKKIAKCLLILLIAFVASTAGISCQKKMGCPQDQYNDWKKIQENNKAMQKNKMKKQKGKASNDMGPQETSKKKKK